MFAVIFCEGKAVDTTKVSKVAQKLTASQRRALLEEAEQWDQLTDEDFAGLFDEGKPVHIRLPRPPPKTLTVAPETIENKFSKG